MKERTSVGPDTNRSIRRFFTPGNNKDLVQWWDVAGSEGKWRECVGWDGCGGCARK